MSPKTLSNHSTHHLIFITLLAIVLSSVSITGNANSNKVSNLEQCKRISTKIDKLTQRRRAGGSAQQMNKWKKKRGQLSNEFYHLKCRKHGILK